MSATKSHRAVLLDLGNVVLGVDFHRVFRSWAQSAEVDAQRFYARWSMDDAYKAHETGEIDFAAYTETLSSRFEVELSQAQWRRGWNDIWTEPFHGVIELLPQIAAQLPLYGFTNTNDTHAEHWRASYAPALRAFEHIFVSSEIGVRKPDVEAFEQVCSTINHAPEHVVFLDDTQENIEGALACGLDARLVSSESDVVEQLSRLLNQ